MIRALARATLAAAALATGGGSLWALSQNPFTAPTVDRAAAEVRLAVERAMAREVTPAWLMPRLETALAGDDRDRVEMLSDLARTYGIPLPSGLEERVEAALAPRGRAAAAQDCALCALDIGSCRSLAQIGACAIPFELTPFGDANALRRQAGAALAGEEVDRIETGLALVGLGATGAVVVSGGGSYPVKVAASGIRAARRMGSLTPGFTRVLSDAADMPVNWSAAVRGGPVGEITDAAQLTRLRGIVDDVATVGRNTSPADTLALLRHVDTAEDAARLARVSDAMGLETRMAFEVLGPARTFRALTRVSDLALLTLGLLTALVVQLGTFTVSLVLRAARRGLREG